MASSSLAKLAPSEPPEGVLGDERLVRAEELELLAEFLVAFDAVTTLLRLRGFLLFPPPQFKFMSKGPVELLTTTAAFLVLVAAVELVDVEAAALFSGAGEGSDWALRPFLSCGRPSAGHG